MKTVSRIVLVLMSFLIWSETVAAQSEKIVFASTRDADTTFGASQLYVMDPDGTNLTRLTNNSYIDGGPSFSPDGSKIVFHSSRAGNLDIYLMNSDGTNETRLTTDIYQDSHPSFSPDGSKITFTSRRDENYEIYVMNIDGTNQINLTNNPAAETVSSYSADGNQIAFYSNRFNGADYLGEIYVMNADGSNPINLSNNSVSDRAPKYSNDGSKIVYESNGQIYVMNADGTNQIKLTSEPIHAGEPTFSPDGTQIAYTSLSNDGRSDILTMNVDGTDQLNRTQNPSHDFAPSWGGKKRRPVLIIPGIAGTYSANTNDDEFWLLNRGSQPADLQIDPLGRVYNDLIKTFENVGYVKDKDLFVVNYDWRLPPGPLDGTIDGVNSIIDAQSISDQNYEFGVDYLGRALRLAYERWEADHPGEKLEEVDIVAHSTGGLVARTYIQSPANGADFGGGEKLPKIKNLIMVGVPNRGASKAWNPLQDNWIADRDYQYILSKIVNRAYQKVLAGAVISGPPDPITLATISNGAGIPEPQMFINQYVPTLRSLLATYDFIDHGSGFTNVNSNLARRNTWILDLNNGLDLFATADPSPFANECKPTVIYGSTESTATAVRQIFGSAGTHVIAPFADFVARDAEAGEIWFDDIVTPSSGDGTVPLDSSIGQFVGDSRVILKTVTTGNVTHTGLMSNVEVQKTILQTVEASFQIGDISTGIAQGQLIALTFILDPVDGFVVDGAGRRLGYSESTGGLAEIPNSIWFGNQNGMGWVFGEIQGPLSLELTGRGESYYVMVSAQTPNGNGGIIDSGFLALGTTRSLPITLGEPAQFNCPKPKGYWKSNPVSWRVDTLLLGGVTYTKQDLLKILGTAAGSGKNADASLILAYQLIAAKLNIANNSDPAAVSAVIAEADSLLSAFEGKLPYRVVSKSVAGQSMVRIASNLDSYNNGLFTPLCHP